MERGGGALRKPWIALAFLIFAVIAHATTYNVTTSSNLQNVINGASAGDTIVFAAGTYTVGTELNGKCGITYTGPQVWPTTAILNSTMGTNSSIFYLGSSSCSQTTTVEYLDFVGSGGIYVQTPFQNLSILHNQFGSIPGVGYSPNGPETGIWINNGNPVQSTFLTNANISWNLVGDNNSCTAALADAPSDPSGDGTGGGCTGMQFWSSMQNVTVDNNIIYHIGEGIHIQCPSDTCEPPNGPVINGLDAEYNDFSTWRRAAWEHQPQVETNVILAHNTWHDPYNSVGWTWGASMACCWDGATSPYLNVSSNTMIFNQALSGYAGGYGYEGGGYNANYVNNLSEASVGWASGIAWGCGPNYSDSYNTITGQFGGSGDPQAIVQEFSNPDQGDCNSTHPGNPPAVKTGNVTSGNNISYTSVAPTITLSGSTFTFHDPGYTAATTPLPLGNTGIWYCVSPCTPSPGGSGSTYVVDGATLTVSTSTTLKAVGMWGALNQVGNNMNYVPAGSGIVTTYPSGMGWTPSAVVTGPAYTSGPTTATPVISPASGTPPQTVTITDASPSPTIHYTTDGTTPTTASPTYTAPFSVPGLTTTTVQAIATSAGLATSQVSTGTYTYTPPPALQSCYQSNTNPYTNTIPVGGTVTQVLQCQYNSGPSPIACSPTADANGTVVTSWGTLAPTIVNVGNVSAAAGCSSTNQGPGCVVGTAPGNGNITAYASQNGGTPMACGQWTFYVEALAATPTFSPAAETFTSPVAVTISSATGGATIYYTTDGSTPTTASNVYASPVSVSATTTIKAIAAASGSSNSTVGSALYTSGAPPALSSVSLTGAASSIAIGGHDQITATCRYSGGATTSCNTTDAYGNQVSTWNTSNAGTATINSAGLATGVASGTVNLTAIAAGVTSSPFSLTVTPGAPSLTSVALTTAGSVTSLATSATNQLTATCTYSDSSTSNCTGTASSWTSSATATATVSSGGLVTGVAAGSTNLAAVVGGITSPSLPLTITTAPQAPQGGYLGTPGSANTLTVGGTLQFSASCYYPGSITTNCTGPTPDSYGNAVTTWASSNTAQVTIGQVGSANPGLATGIATGTPYIVAHVGTLPLSQWNLTVSAPPVTLTGISLATTGSVTGLLVGHTNQLVATCAYSDGSNTNCTATDSHGTVAGTYLSSNTSHATVSSSGLVSGIAPGGTNLTAVAGSFTSPNLALTVLAIPTGIYTITISGPVKFSGRVRF